VFSGLVREIAQVKNFANNTLEVFTPYKAKLGDSIAINGACLTAVSFFSGGMAMELSKHTQEHIALENYAQGAFVHLEPALQVGDRFDGHIVQGHIDSIGRITRIEHNADSSDFWIQAPAQSLLCIIPKGSVCVEGISLTIVERINDSFKLTIIPHTLQNTLFGRFEVGRRVNIETDVITRSVVSTLQFLDSQHLQNLGILAQNGNGANSSHRNNRLGNVSWGDIDAQSLSY